MFQWMLGATSDRRNGEREPELRLAQQAARIAVEPGSESCSEQEIEHRVLGEDSQAERNAEDDASNAGPRRPTSFT